MKALVWGLVLTLGVWFQPASHGDIVRFCDACDLSDTIGCFEDNTTPYGVALSVTSSDDFGAMASSIRLSDQETNLGLPLDPALSTAVASTWGETDFSNSIESAALTELGIDSDMNSQATLMKLAVVNIWTSEIASTERLVDSVEAYSAKLGGQSDTTIFAASVFARDGLSDSGDRYGTNQLGLEPALNLQR